MNDTKKLSVLLVDDHTLFRKGLAELLEQRGDIEVAGIAGNADDALRLLAEKQPDVVITDLNMPPNGGLALLRQIRADKWAMPVLILTARGSWAERIDGLKAGADDYLSKPFHPEELALRIQALLRRAHGVANQSELKAAGLALDEARQCVRRGDEEIALSGAEFRLLRYFMLHPGQILSKTQLNEHLYDGESERDSNVIEVHVNHLRRKLGRGVIETRRGQGYRYAGDAEQDG